MLTTKKGTGVNLATLDTRKLTKKQLKQLTTKEQRLELKATKKHGNQKTANERAAEVVDIKNSLQKWELDERFLAIATLYDRLDHFVRTGEAVMGRIPFPECPPAPMGRTIAFKFTNMRGHKGTCDLLVRDNQEYLDELRAEQTPSVVENTALNEPDDNTAAPNLVSVTTNQEDLETLLNTAYDGTTERIKVL